MNTDIPNITEVDCSTGIQTVRPMTDEEIVNWEAIKAESARLQIERESLQQAKIAAKESALAKLTALGLTEEEANAIAGI